MADQKVKRDLPAELQIVLHPPDRQKPKNLPFLLKNRGFWAFGDLGDAKQFVTPRGGPVRLFGLPWGLSPSQGGSRQKEISDPPHPLR